MLEGTSLRRRLTWYVIISMLVMTAISGTAVYYGTTHEADEMFSASLVQTARILDGFISKESIINNKDRLSKALQYSRIAENREATGGHEYEDKLFFSILNQEGQVLLRSHLSPDVPVEGLANGFSEFREKENKWTIFVLPSSHDNLRIVAGERNDIKEEMIDYIGRGLLIPLVLLLPVIIWMLWKIFGIALNPLEKVTNQVLRQDIKQLKSINVDGVPLEISPLVNALNQMIENLEGAYFRERRFVSDASHELRNPLAALLINVDNAIEESTNPDVEDSLQDMKTSIIRLTHLVSQLLELSHSENPLSSKQFEPINLRQLCSQVVDSYRSSAQSKCITLELLPASDDCKLMGVNALLISLVSNLVDNAIKYCAQNSTVHVSCERDQNHLVLAIEDTGSGLDAADREKVIERFYRADETSSSGAGLGLSIVKTIAEVHSATMQIERSDLGGLSVKIYFAIP
jgi:two-component system sensor histidine kinase QseC